MIRRSPEVLWRSTSRGPVVLAPTDQAAEVLGGIGAVVWELLDEPMDLDALRSAAAGSGYDAAVVDPALVEAAVTELLDLGLLRPT